MIKHSNEFKQKAVRHWLNRSGPLFSKDVYRQKVSRTRGFCQWKWHLDEVEVRIKMRDLLPVARSRHTARNPRDLRHRDNVQTV